MMQNHSYGGPIRGGLNTNNGFNRLTATNNMNRGLVRGVGNTMSEKGEQNSVVMVDLEDEDEYIQD